MTGDLRSFSSPVNAAVIGASGGIGSALVRRLSDAERIKHIYALSRSAMDDMMACYAVNTFGPALVAKYFLPKLPRDRRGVFACLSAIRF